MKTWFLVLVAMLCFTGIAKAEDSGITVGDVFKNSPSVKTGVFYNINDSKWQVLNELTIVQGTGKLADFSIDAGYADQGIFALSVNYDLIKLENYGVKLPILKDLVANVGWTAGWKRVLGSDEFCTGPEAVMKVNLKF